MADSDGYSNPRLDRPDARHVKLMTNHAVFIAEHEKFVAGQEEHWRRYQIQREEDRQRGIALDNRIAEMVSGIGEFHTPAAGLSSTPHATPVTGCLH